MKYAFEALHRVSKTVSMATSYCAAVSSRGLRLQYEIARLCSELVPEVIHKYHNFASHEVSIYPVYFKDVQYLAASSLKTSQALERNSEAFNKNPHLQSTKSTHVKSMEHVSTLLRKPKC